MSKKVRSRRPQVQAAAVDEPIIAVGALVAIKEVKDAGPTLVLNRITRFVADGCYLQDVDVDSTSADAVALRKDWSDVILLKPVAAPKKGDKVFALYDANWNSEFPEPAWTTEYYPATVSAAPSAKRKKAGGGGPTQHVIFEGDESSRALPPFARIRSASDAVTSFEVPTIVLDGFVAQGSASLSAALARAEQPAVPSAAEKSESSASAAPTLGSREPAKTAASGPPVAQIDRSDLQWDDTLPEEDKVLPPAEKESGDAGGGSSSDALPPWTFCSSLGATHRWDRVRHLKSKNLIVAPYVLRW